MAPDPFDEVAKALTTSVSRRQTLRVFLASALGSRFGLGNIGTVQAVDEMRVESPAPAPSLPSPPSCGSPQSHDLLWCKVRNCLPPLKPCSPSTKCTAIDLHNTANQKWILLQEPATGLNNYTFVAGERITGIECPEIWQLNAPDYWTFAWNEAQKFLSKKIVGMAINSKHTRRDHQFHIHLSCINLQVLRILEMYDKAGTIPRNQNPWKTVTLSLPVINPKTGQPIIDPKTKKQKYYKFRVLISGTLHPNGRNLFNHLLYDVVMDTKKMQFQTLVVAQRRLSGGGFYIINGTERNEATLTGSTGAGEKLLNETC